MNLDDTEQGPSCCSKTTNLIIDCSKSLSEKNLCSEEAPGSLQPLRTHLHQRLANTETTAVKGKNLGGHAGTCRRRPFHISQEICSVFVGC